jgi:hypothetical protein
LLFRDCNAAIPVIDEGMDVFAFRDDREDVARIQVKSAQGSPYKKGGGYWAQFNVPMKRLSAADVPPLYFAFAVRLEGRWVSFLVIGRCQLREYWEGDRSFGTENPKSGELALRVTYRPDPEHRGQLRVRCGDVDLDAFLDAWGQLPPLRALPQVTSGQTADLPPAIGGRAETAVPLQD